MKIKASLIVLALAFAPVPLQAATIEEIEAALPAVKAALADANAKAEDMAKAVQAASRADHDIGDQLIALADKMRLQQADIAAADIKIAALEQRRIGLSSDLAEKRAALVKLLAGLLHLQGDPPPALLVSPEDAVKAVRGAMVFNAAVPEVQRRADELKAQLAELQAVKQAAVTERQTRQSAVDALVQGRLALEKLQQDKHGLVEAMGRDLARQQQEATGLAAKAKDLGQLLDNLQKAKVADEKAVAKAKADEARAEAQRMWARLSPPQPFVALKGQLNYPIDGEIIKHYGEVTDLGTKLDGLALASAPQSIVTTPISGQVAFAGSFRSYGQLLILDAGEGYLVLLAGMAKITASLGQTVRAGEPIGEMGAGTSTLALLGAAPQNRPILYVEFRQNNLAVDPTPWWKLAKKEALQ